jgi:hypothetical protein
VNRAEMNFAILPDPVATARGSDTASKRLGYGKVIRIGAHPPFRNPHRVPKPLWVRESAKRLFHEGDLAVLSKSN